jgi:hypothetical protein
MISKTDWRDVHVLVYIAASSLQGNGLRPIRCLLLQTLFCMQPISSIFVTCIKRATVSASLSDSCWQSITRSLYLVACILPQGVGWVLSVAFFVDSVLVGTALQRMNDCCVRTGIKVRAALISEVSCTTSLRWILTHCCAWFKHFNSCLT